MASVARTRTFRESPLDLDKLLRSNSGPMDELAKRRITARVKQAREEAGISQEEMASLLGLTHRAYQWYESQKDPRPPLRRLKEIAEITGKSQEWLLRGDVDEVVDVSVELAELKAAIDRIEALLRGERPPPGS